MQAKIVLFDIDGVLFDPKTFLSNFYTKLSEDFKLDEVEIEKVKQIYGQSRKETAYFIPEDFLKRISDFFPSLRPQKINELFWNKNLLSSSLYQDSQVLESISKIAKIGIFSKGDFRFQQAKLATIGSWVDKDCIHIFPNKIAKISEILNIYVNSRLYLIDDDINVLRKAKQDNPEIVAILIERETFPVKNGKIDKIVSNLFEIGGLINE